MTGLSHRFAGGPADPAWKHVWATVEPDPEQHLSTITVTVENRSFTVSSSVRVTDVELRSGHYGPTLDRMVRNIDEVLHA